MARKVAWPMLLLAGFVGYVVGNVPGQQEVVGTSPNVTAVPKSERATLPDNQKQTTAIVPKAASPPRSGVDDYAKRLKSKSQPTRKEPSTKTTMYVDADRLNVRGGPGLSYKQVWTLKRDDAVAVTGVSGVWRQIRGERFAGWVHGGYLTPKPSPKPVRTTAVEQQAGPARPSIADSEIRKRLIERSIALYSGSCPCPYNVTRNGSRCGGRSAYSRPGGASPLCYDRDVSNEMIAAYRARQ